uniref:SdrD_B domain-containing protein n=2 Tax=Bursaphelenchus xylophilus TaxID=6326 RepID=A0A1I7S883_BURXY
MVAKGEDIALGGQVSTKGSNGASVNCPVAGDTNKIRTVTERDSCDADFEVYRVQDKLYGIPKRTQRNTYIFGLDGKKINSAEIPVVVDDKLGVNQANGTYVYKDGDGKCQEVTVGALSPPWKAKPCAGGNITLIANKNSEWYHVQYLEVVHNCLNSTIPGDKLKKAYVRFFSDGSSDMDYSTATEETPFWTEDTQMYVGIGGGCFLFLILIGLSVLGFFKRRAIMGCLRKKKKRGKGSEKKKADEKTKTEVLKVDSKME